MAEQFAHDVFLCHASADTPVVRDLAERLRADGLLSVSALGGKEWGVGHRYPGKCGGSWGR